MGVLGRLFKLPLHRLNHYPTLVSISAIKMSTTRPFLLGVLAFGAAASAQGNPFLFRPNGSLYLGNDVTGFAADSWSSAFASGFNATSKVAIKSYDITAEYPGSELPAEQSWSWTIRVKASIGPLAFPSNDTLSQAAGTWLQVQHPKSDLVEIGDTGSFMWQVPKHPSWSTCGVVFVSPDWTRDSPLPGPGCAGVLSADCITEIQRNLEEAYKSEDLGGPIGGRGKNQCPAPRPALLPERCRPSGTVGLGAGLTREIPDVPPGAVLEPSDSGIRGGHSNGTIDVLAFAHLGNATVVAYKQAVQQVYVVGHIWGPNGETDEANSREGAAGNPRAEVTCLKAERVESGDGGGDEGQNGNGNGEEEEEDLGNPFVRNAAVGLGVSTGDLCKLALVFVATSFLSL
ncbi:hypothetical protein QBC41DRAFT_313600 [Cercophora samala]|uniref:Uncharacterized protein n=1 Tax=Cercophora samala TaxID=330535 RepID=A0AA40DFQ8_9PEZI|nr:hypothetical protein QBC41DRAFT_313600 [Cercophora samala]